MGEPRIDWIKTLAVTVDVNPTLTKMMLATNYEEVREQCKAVLHLRAKLRDAQGALEQANEETQALAASLAELADHACQHGTTCVPDGDVSRQVNPERTRAVLALAGWKHAEARVRELEQERRRDALDGQAGLDEANNRVRRLAPALERFLESTCSCCQDFRIHARAALTPEKSEGRDA